MSDGFEIQTRGVTANEFLIYYVGKNESLAESVEELANELFFKNLDVAMMNMTGETDKEIREKSEAQAKSQWTRPQSKYKRVTVTRENRDRIRKDIEQLPDFIEWYAPFRG